MYVTQQLLPIEDGQARQLGTFIDCTVDDIAEWTVGKPNVLIEVVSRTSHQFVGSGDVARLVRVLGQRELDVIGRTVAVDDPGVLVAIVIISPANVYGLPILEQANEKITFMCATKVVVGGKGPNRGKKEKRANKPREESLHRKFSMRCVSGNVTTCPPVLP